MDAGKHQSTITLLLQDKYIRPVIKKSFVWQVFAAGLQCRRAQTISRPHVVLVVSASALTSDLISIHSTFGQRKQQWMSENGYLYECLMNALTETEDSD